MMTPEQEIAVSEALDLLDSWDLRLSSWFLGFDDERGAVDIEVPGKDPPTADDYARLLGDVEAARDLLQQALDDVP